MAVGIRRALQEVEALALGNRTHAVGLGLGMQGPQGATGVATVAHLAHSPERAVEAEILGNRLDDLLQSRRDDVDPLAPFAVALD